ncbi:hypothetical protein [Flavobacterium selenitireducens]|uniref:hypothetical protein n=1 Tax=Flavobacterium selenitireducens TaxID=2722704 RepID=UPI00168AE66C|nr:hypothetical protein [Flavobacterium selenitireducens]MBD3582163.1 hypothetical protein [Flavobacterium selenitireducens]
MKKEEVPQDEGNLSKNNVRELLYATDEQGNYTTALSKGWEPKSIALANAMDDISDRMEAAKAEIRAGNASPILYFMEAAKMDIGILASYVGIWKWRVKRHFKPSIFAKLSDNTLQKYADAFDIGIDQLKNFKAE